MYQEITLEITSASAVITFNRPARLNALTRRMLAELRHAVAAAEDDRRVVGIILTGAGRGFSAGMDTEALAAGARGDSMAVPTFPELEARPGDPAMGPEFRVTFAYLLSLRKPLLAAVNGPCAGLSFVLATLCDLRFAADSAVFKTAFAQRGLVAEHGVSWILPRLLGASRALDLLWHPRKITAAEALQLGLVNRVVADAELLSTARQYVEDLALASSPASLMEIKQQVYRGLMQPLDVAMNEATARMESSFKRPDFAEGVHSFLEQRAPQFPRLGGE
jgi:enoyl-CoA hydratase/carnithine racemase